MLFLANLRIKIRNFIKKHKNKLIFGIIIWIVIITINIILKNWQEEEKLITTYEPHEPIFETNETVPDKLQDNIESLIDEYIGYCNSKEYEKAYNMITEECRQAIYPHIEDFKAYVNYVFRTKKIYNIQNYSNKNGKYIYRVRILDDILLTGLTGETSVTYFEDKLVIEQKEGELRLAIKGYIGIQNMEKVYEDKYMKVVINKKENLLDQETYTMQITNRTDNYLVISDNTYEKEITLSINDGETQVHNRTDIIILPNSKEDIDLSFVLFYDEGQEGTKLNFNKVRILKDYSTEENEENIVETYSTNIPLK